MSPRGTFGPVVLLGIAAAGLSAAAGSQPWATSRDYGVRALVSDSAELPLAGALGLVALACWGVILVTRGQVRRTVALLGALVSVGLLITVVIGFGSAPDALREAAAEIGITDAEVGRTGWYYAAVVGAVLSLAAGAVAVRLTPHWPEMGSRYDAPGAAEQESVPPEERSSLDLWRSLDEGQDPTA